MAVITTGNHPKALWPGVKAWWGRQYDEHKAEYPDLFERDDSNKSYEETVELTGFGLAPVKSEGSSVAYDSETQGVTTRFTNVAYALGYAVTREERDDNLYEIVSKRRARANAFSMAQTKENVAANIINNGFTATGADGVALFSTAHPTITGSQSNRLTVDADLSEASLEDLIIQVMNTTNSRGLRISLMPQSLHVAPANWFEANRILKSTLQNDTASNAVNALKATNALPKGIMVNHYFTDADAWFVKTNCPEGLKHFQRVAIQFTQDNDFDTENAKAKSYERYSFGYSDFRGIFGSAGA